MAGENNEIRDIILQLDIVEPIANLLDAQIAKTDSDSFIETATWALKNLCRGRSLHAYSKINCCVPALARVFIKCSAIETLIDVAWALVYITEKYDTTQIMKDLFQTAFLAKLVPYLEHPNFSVRMSCLRTLANIF